MAGIRRFAANFDDFLQGSELLNSSFLLCERKVVSICLNSHLIGTSDNPEFDVRTQLNRANLSPREH